VSKTIGSLSVGRKKPVYRRASGELFLKLNERFHVRTVLDETKEIWLGDGSAEELDPNEEVEVIQNT